MEIDKTKLIDTQGRPLSQSLFLELGYNKEYAYYTLKDQDHHWGGQTYYSLKRLYLAHEDAVEYDFANTYLLGWNQWQKICNNGQMAKHIESWREELELKMRSEAFKNILEMTAEGSFQASKWLADKGWEKKGVGRPNTKAKEREDALLHSIENDYREDIKRLN